MNILYVTSEAVPFCKTGGLADVAGSLPQALAANGDRVSVILPLYERVKDKWGEQLHFEKWTFVRLAWRSVYCGLFSLERDGVTWYLSTMRRISAAASSTATMTTASALAFSPAR